MTFDLTGRIAAVDAVPLGGVLAEDAPAGSTALVLEDTADFNEDGGILVINSVEQVEYTTVDDEAGVVELASPTTAAYDTEARVELFDPATGLVASEVQAQVLVEGWEDAGDSLTATVDHALIPYLASGIRDTDPATGLTGEAVALEWRGDELYVVDVLGRAPVFDGSVIDPETLPPTYEPTPEEPDTPAAPTVLGGVGALYVRWTAVLHPNPVVYEVHVSDVTPVVPSAATLVQEVTGTAATIRRLPKPDEIGNPDTALRYDLTYYVAVRAKDSVDGAFMSDLSDAAAGSPVQLTGEDIAVNSVATENLVAGSVQGETLAGQLVLGSKIVTAEQGQRVEIDPAGIRLHGPDDNVLIDLPTAPGASPSFRGQVQADGLTVRQGATFYSPWNEFARSSVINLAEGILGPATGPVAESSWDQVLLDNEPVSGTLGTFGLNGDEIGGAGQDLRTGGPRTLVFQNRPNGTRVWYYNADGSIHDFEDRPDWEITGAYRTDSAHVQFGRKISTGQWQFRRTNGTFARYNPVATTTKITMSWNGTDILLAEKNGSPTRGFRMRRVNISTSPVSILEDVTTDDNDPTPESEGMAFVYKGSADFGSTRWVVAQANQEPFMVFTTGGNPESERWWPTPATTGGAYWSAADGVFYTLGRDRVLYKHTTFTWTDPDLDTWHVGQSFLDTNATGGTHETAIGRLTTFSAKKRAKIRLSLVEVPFASGADAPNAWAVYAKRGAAPLADRSDMWRQATGAYTTQTYERSTAPVTSGTAAKIVGDFPAGEPAVFRSTRTMPSSSNPVIEFKGDGSARLGTIQVNSSGQVTAVYPDTGWVTVNTNHAAMTGSIQFRRIGNEVWARGSVGPRTDGSWGSVTNVSTPFNGNIPAEFLPGASHVVTLPTADSNGSVTFRVTVNTGAESIQVRPSVASWTGSGPVFHMHYLAD